MQYNPEKYPPLTNRTQRENELKTMLANHDGRNQLTQLLRAALNIPSGQLPVGTPFVQTILDHEFAEVAVVPVAPTMPLPLA